MIAAADMGIFGNIGSALCCLWVLYCSCNIHIFTLAIAMLSYSNHIMYVTS